MAEENKKEKILPIRKEEIKTPSPEELRPQGEVSFIRRFIPPRIATVGRSLKLRDLFTLSGTVASDSTVVTVTAASGGTETDMKSFRIFPNEWHVGMCIRITAIGVYTSDGTRTITARIGSGLAATTEWNSMTSTAASTTNAPWHLVWTGIVTTLGASGTLEAQMIGKINNVNKDDANSATVTINTTTAITVALTGDWDGTSAGNTFSVRQFTVEVLY